MRTWPLFFSIGFIGLIFYLFIVIIGIGNQIRFENLIHGMFALIYCTPIVFLPSLIFILLGWRDWNKGKYLRKVAKILAGSRPIDLTELATTFNKTKNEIELDVFECINEGLIQGFIEPGSKRFVVMNVPEGTIKNKKMQI